MNNSKSVFAAIDPSFMPTLLELLLQMREGQINHPGGICLNLDIPSSMLDCSAWEHFSGDKRFPVPSQNKKQTHETAYMTNDTWSKRTAYGRMRWKLLDWLIEQAQMWIEGAPKMLVFEDIDTLPRNAYRKHKDPRGLRFELENLNEAVWYLGVTKKKHQGFKAFLTKHNLDWTDAPHGSRNPKKPFADRKCGRRVRPNDIRQLDTLKWLIQQAEQRLAQLANPL